MKGRKWRCPLAGVGLLSLAVAVVGPRDVRAVQKEADVPSHEDVTKWLAELENQVPAFEIKSAASSEKRDEGTSAAAVSVSAAAGSTGAFGLDGVYGGAARISVDFFKVDLHNVFRLLGQVSGKNIVVDEEVSGTLTLALQDTPWTFVLDIIKNLKDLQSEERFNTILIFPKKKAVDWTTDETTGASGELVFQPTKSRPDFKIEKKAGAAEIPAMTAEAYRLIDLGREAEAAQQYSKARDLYEKGLNDWPSNSLLAKKLAALCLGRLEDNLAALRYAKQALQVEPRDATAAAHAALALARLGKVDEARAYFEKALLSEPPPFALHNYAVFCEEQGGNRQALRLLQRYVEVVGPSAETMLMRARLLARLGRSGEAIVEYRALLRSGSGDVTWQMKRYAETQLAQLESNNGGTDAATNDTDQQ
jgi:type IV pilus assembly protein PilQ